MLSNPESTTCSYCGLVLPSPASVAIHQMVVDLSARCHRCREWTDGEDERSSHVCSSHNVDPEDDEDEVMGKTTNSKELLCPLGCPATRRFDRCGMEAHLSTLHGCDEDYSMADDGKVDVDPDMMAACPLCAASLNIMEKSMLTHVFYQCNGRCPLLRETVKGLRDLANEIGLDCDLLVRMELESVVHHWTHSISDRDYVERCQLNDLKYNMLTPGVWYDCECAPAAKVGGMGGRTVRAQFTGGLCRCKSFSASYPWSPPLGHTAEEVRARRDDLPFLVTLWNASLKQLNPRVAGAARDVRDHLKSGLGWKSLHQEEEDQPPEASVLRRLQGELNFAVVDEGVTSDARLIDDNFRAAGLGAGCMAEEDGAQDI